MTILYIAVKLELCKIWWFICFIYKHIVEPRHEKPVYAICERKKKKKKKNAEQPAHQPLLFAAETVNTYTW